jgi:hypothetical protein
MIKIANLFWSVDDLVHLSNSVLLSMPVLVDRQQQLRARLRRTALLRLN